MAYKLIYLARRNPNVKAEDWPRHWRSHAVYCSQFPVIGGSLNSLFYCSRMLEPTLEGARVEPSGVADYDGVAVVSSPTSERGGTSPELRAKIDADELRVFSTYTPKFSFYCQEGLVHGEAHGKAAVIRFLARKSESSPEDFKAHWNGQHADIAKRTADAGGATRYVHDELIEPPPPGYPFEGITETWFPTTDGAVRSLTGEAIGPLTQDIAGFCDPARSVTMLTYVTHSWPRV